MQTNRQERLRSANRRLRRGRKATGRIVVSALGFGVAYYFDTQNGRLRRKRLEEMLHRTVGNFGTVRASEEGDAPPVFYPVLQALREEGRVSHVNARVEAAR